MKLFLRKCLGCILLCCFFSINLWAQTGPAGINTGTVLWLDAGDVLNGGTAPAYGTTLTTWYDKSGSGRNAVSSGANPVIFNSGGANDRPVVRFNRTSASAGSGMTVNGLDIRAGTNADVTIFAVYRPGTNDGNTQAVWGNDNGGSQQRYFNSKAATGTTDASLNTGGTAVVIPGGAKAGETRLVTAMYSSGANNGSAVYLNGKLISAFTDQTSNTGGQTNFRIGLDGDNNYFNGDISELIVYNRTLTACEVETINIYLANKYATDFTDMSSNYTLGIPFNNDINGVGIRTSACSGTYNMSASFSGILSVTNPSQTNNNVVLSFANDRAGYGQSSQTPSSHISRLQQVWRADLNGNIGTVDICFELTGLGIDVSNSGNFALLIDKDGDFSNATVISTGVTIMVNRVCISGVNLTKGDYFTLATRAATSVASEITSANKGIAQKSLFTTASIIDDQILVKGASNVKDGRVYIDTGFVVGDVITWGTLPTGVTGNYNATTGVAVFTGTAPATAWQNFYRTLRFSTSSGNTGNRTIRFVLGNVVSYTVGTKPHYYEYITTPMSWTAAKAAAEARTLYGLQGYLATITAQIENDFITSKLSSDGWVGGTCNYQVVNDAVGSRVFNNQNSAYGAYYWVTGPEKGTPISTGLNNPVPVNGAYTKWNTGEPNNYQGTNELYMQLYSTNQGRWNDLPNTSNLGYVVEYGGYASDPVLNIDYSRVIMNAPPAPVIVSITDDTGLSASDNITNDPTLRLNGTGQASAIIRLFRADIGAIAGTATVNAAGNWSFDYTGTSLADGTYSFTATATTGSNTSAASPAFTVTIDLIAPAKPGRPALASGSGNATNDVTPDLTGSAEPGSFVRIYDGATQIGTATTNAAGVWTLTAPTMSATLHNITVTATDVAGNTSVSSDPFPLTIDVTAPARPPAPTLVGGVGNVTNDNTPTIRGTAEANSTVTVYNGNTIAGTTSADASGNYTFTFPTLADAPYTVSVTATDAAGNTSARSPVLNFTVDTQPPTVPTLNGTAILTGDNTPTITGATDPNTSVTIFRDGIAVGTVTSNGSGNFTYTFSPALPDATYVITATATDAVGNESVPSAPLSLTIDATAPAAPVITTDRLVTNNNTPTITGTAEANSTVTIYSGTIVAGTLTATSSGTFSYTFTTLADGVYAVSATATDAAGNVSPRSNVLNITVDTQTPPAPIVVSRTTPANDNTPTVIGTAEANSTVTLYADGVAAGTTTANASGAYTFTFPASLADGIRSITARATDAANNTGPLSARLNILIDTEAPAAPTLLTAKNPTNDNTPTVSGTAEANSTVNIIVDGVTVGTAAADGSGNYTYTLPTALADGNYTIRATATDAAGNTGPSSATLNLLVDTQAPAAPILTTAKNPTNDNTPTVSGTAEANSTVTIIVDGSAVGTAPADASGNYTFTMPTALSDGTHAITATATDAAGNTSTPSTTLNLVIDTQVPTAPTITTTNNPTNDNTPTVTGTAEANSTVTIIVDGSAIGTAPANASGNYTFTMPTALSDGIHAITATATDAAGNTSAPSTTLNLVVDTQVPTVPTITTVKNPTNDNTPTVTGTAEANSTVTIIVDGSAVGTVTANASGTYTFNMPTALSDGTHAITATATDAAGNTSAPSTTLNLVIDTQVPTVPTITTAKNPTNDNTPTVTGTAEANSTVTIIVDGSAVGTVTANASGNYTFTMPTALSDGTHAITATATDAAGNTSAPSTTLNLVIDTQVPTVPTITTAKNPTNDNTPTVTGTAEANSTLTIIVDGSAVGTATANASGNYTFTMPTALSDGTHAVTATATDAAGNTSAPSTTLNLVVDTQVPLAPTLTTAKNPTNDNTPTVTGTAEANSTVIIIVDGSAVGTAPADASGNYTFTMPVALSDGTHAVTATATDAAGNTSAPSTTLNLVVDTQVPTVPTINTAKNPTNDNTPTVTGTAEANSTVTIIVDGSSVGTAPADASGNYTFTMPTALSDGTHAITATATDAAGNTSTPSTTLNLVIDTQVPTVPTITTAKNPTNDNTPTVTGTAEANSTVTIIVDGSAVGTAPANASGNYTFTMPTALSDGTHAITATATDAAGNTSAPSTTLNLVIDTQVPTVPTITTAKNPTNDNTPTVTGTAEANSTVTIIVDGSAVGTVTANASGTYTFTMPTALSDGIHAITATATDAAGNTSAPSTTLNLVVDTQVPTVPTITTAKNPTNDNTPIVSGTAEANSTVTIIVGGSSVGTAPADASGNYTFTMPTALSDGTHAITATATDAAGNTSAPSTTLNLVVDTQVPLAPTLTTSKNPTNDNTPTVTGTAEANSTVTIIVDGSAVGTVTANASGNYTFTMPTALSDGTHAITATATDAAGNTSAPSTTLNLVIDTQVPTVPTITTVKNPTNDNTPTVTGTAEANSTVNIIVRGLAVGTAAADASGNYTFTMPTALSDGTHAITATATDAAGNTSAPSTTLNLVIDTQVPTIPTITTAKNPTNDNAPTVTGTAEENSTVTIIVDGSAVGTAPADASGNYTFTMPTALSDGTHAITATATDAAGNTSAPSTTLNLVIDTQVPTIPTITTAKNPTNDNTPTVSGTAETNSTVTIIVDGSAVGTVTANASGNYTFTMPAALSDGTHAITATATDAAGNTSAPSTTLNLVIDTQVPTVPTITTAKNPTNDNTPTVSGTAEANSTVTIIVDGSAVGTATANASGTYTFAMPTALSDGTHAVTATATDAAGNTSAPSTTLNLVIDTDAPLAPTLTTAKNPTNDNTPTVTGTAEANSTVTIIVGGTPIGKITADANGNYSYTFNLALTDGPHTVTATATDASGNTSPASTPLNITIDTQAPVAPTVTTAKNPTNDHTPVITGKAEPNSTVTIYNGDSPVGTAPVNASGDYTYTFSPSLPDGTHNVTATATDAAGNTSVKSNVLPITVITNAPATPPAPVLADGRPGGLINDPTPSIKGIAEANSKVTIYLNGNSIGTTTAGATGNYTYTFNPALPDADYAITVTATDIAGNISAQSPALNITIDASAPATPAAPELVGSQNGLTNDATPSITGKAEPNSTVTIYVDGKAVGNVKADSKGEYTYTFTPALADGKHNITVTATDAAGNTSGISPALVIVIDTQAPQPPTLTTGKQPTNNTTPALTGKAEPNSTVTIYVDGKVAGTVTADGNGDYSYTITPALADGEYNVTATSTDAAGNTSRPSTTLNIIVDTKAPDAPTIELVTPAYKGVINTTKPIVAGVAEPNSTVAIYADGKFMGTVVAAADGKYTYTFTSPGLSQGSHQVSATASDAAGNISLPGTPLIFAVDVIAPEVPAPPILPGINIPGLVNTAEPTITGHGEPGTMIIIYTDGKAIGSANVRGNGEWSYTYTPPLTEGDHYITVTASDVQNNESGHSAQVVMTVDLTRPEVSLFTLSAEPLSGPVTFMFTFTEDIIGFESEDINIVGGKVTQFKQLSPSSYAVVIAPDIEGILQVNLPADHVTDLAGNGNRVSSSLAMRVKFGSNIDMVFPLPATDIVNVRFGGVDDGNVNVTLTSMVGQVVLQQTGVVKNNLMTISTQRVPSGTYVLQVRLRDKVLNTTIVIAR
ncbi:Ig-like domain-containing protein [Chitinophaga rhizophila]|uniref:Ig-like domain repeat protein n=1 Tax=Chitinophaga rhizophila TaxID=2866212 RepID=A0ABS7GHQ2_9BACT|nr:Ig-like domain-containing protein [Chitinophaga rhizophila]MBW8686961.1 Ig-like domain repeat protein [Chitinophaga rhizophila]